MKDESCERENLNKAIKKSFRSRNKMKFHLTWILRSSCCGGGI